MPESWNQFEGWNVGDGYVLGRCVHGGEDTAYFLAGHAIVRLVSGEQAAARLAAWQCVAAFSHPNVMRVLDAGWLERGGLRLAWAALETPDEILGDVLRERALDADECRQALTAACDALAYIHKQGMVHGDLAPGSIVAVGDAIKLTSDVLREPKAEQSPAGDVQALGMAACEMLTRRVPEITGGEPKFSPEEAAAVAPLQEFIRRSLDPDPAKRWSAARLAAYLRDPLSAAEQVGETSRPAVEAAITPPAPEPVVQPAPKPEPVVVAPKPEPVEAAPAVPSAARPVAIPRWAWAAAGVVVAGGALFMGARHSFPAPEPPPARSVAARPSAMASRSATPAPAVETESVDTVRDWRVIVYTYHTARPAEKKAHTINRRFPHFKAEVFTVQPRRGPYLVALGGRMTHDEAVSLQRAARSKGLPRDTFIRNYSH